MNLETFLAVIYSDPSAYERFIADPAAEARRADLSGEDQRALDHLDWDGVELAVRSFAKKREGAKRSFRRRRRFTTMCLWIRLLGRVSPGLLIKCVKRISRAGQV